MACSSTPRAALHPRHACRLGSCCTGKYSMRRTRSYIFLGRKAYTWYCLFASLGRCTSPQCMKCIQFCPAYRTCPSNRICSAPLHSRRTGPQHSPRKSARQSTFAQPDMVGKSDLPIWTLSQVHNRHKPRHLFPKVSPQRIFCIRQTNLRLLRR